jgi:hypothetical protein
MFPPESVLLLNSRVLRHRCKKKKLQDISPIEDYTILITTTLITVTLTLTFSHYTLICYCIL